MLVYLNVIRYWGAPGATHYYGRLERRGCDTIRLAARLTASEAQKLTARDGDFVWNIGDKSERFASLKRLKGLAVRFCGIHIPGAILVIGSKSTCEPMKIINNPSGLNVEHLNTIHEECERLGWWDDGNEYQVQKLSDDWFQIVEKYLREVDSEH